MRFSRTIKSALLIVIAASSAALIWFISSTRAPSLPVFSPGIFAGKIAIDRQLDLVALKRGDTLIIAVADKEWPPVSRLNNRSGGETADVFEILSPSGPVFLSGEREDSGIFSGEVLDRNQKRIGTWNLQPLAEQDFLKTEKNLDALSRFLRLNAELHQVNSQISASEVTVERQKSEIQRLSAYLTEGKSLKQDSDQTYNEKRAELAALQQVKEKKLKEAASLKEKFEISQRFSGMGKLVYLSRSILDAEKAWLNSMYESAAGNLDRDFEELVARAERIMTIKNEIAMEQQRLSAGRGSL